MSIFIDPEATFPIVVRYIPIKNNIGETISAKIIKDDSEPQIGEETLVCSAKGRDFDTLSEILEKSTIINHISAKPMIRMKVFRMSILNNFIVDWCEQDTNGNLIPIANPNIKIVCYDIIKELTNKWLQKTSR